MVTLEILILISCNKRLSLVEGKHPKEKICHSTFKISDMIVPLKRKKKSENKRKNLLRLNTFRLDSNSLMQVLTQSENSAARR